MKRVTCGWVVLCVAALGGCKAVEIEVIILRGLKVPIPDHVKTVAVVASPTTDDLPTPTGGKQMQDLRAQASAMLSEEVTGLLSTHSVGRFTLVDRRNVSKLMKEQRFASTGLVDAETAVQAGRILGAQAMIFGTVRASATSWTKQVQEIDPFASARSGTPQTRVKTVNILEVTMQGTLQMIDTETSQVLVASMPIRATRGGDKGFASDALGMHEVKDPMNLLGEIIREESMRFLMGLYDARRYTLPIMGTSGDKHAIESIKRGPNSYASAIDMYQARVQIKPDDEKAWYNIGVLKLAMHDYEGAKGALKKALQFKPEKEEFMMAYQLTVGAEKFSSSPGAAGG